MSDIYKKCTKCGYQGPDFYTKDKFWCMYCTKDKNKKWADANRKKIQEYNKKRYDKDPTADKKRARKSYRFRKYGLTDEQYHSLLDSQSNKCAICDIMLTKPYVDHCHKIGKVRGILCRHCNWTLGYAKENIEILENCIKYLKENI